MENRSKIGKAGRCFPDIPYRDAGRGFAESVRNEERRHMKKRVLSVFLALALCVGMTVPAFAAESDDILASINGEAI